MGRTFKASAIISVTKRKENKTMKELTTKKARQYNGGGRTGWDIVYEAGRGCVNFGIMIGNAIFGNNASYI